jgi:hypothetical protein
MCKPQSEGGQRCAAHTRGAEEAAFAAMTQALSDKTTDGQSLEQVMGKWTTSAIAYASTPEGKSVFEQRATAAAEGGSPVGLWLASTFQNVMLQGDLVRGRNKEIGDRLRAERESQALTAAIGAPAPTRYVDVVEVAKMLRKQLRRDYPGVKFEVRSSRFSQGTSVDVYYTDDLDERKMYDTLTAYAGRRVDGRIDGTYHAQSWACDKHGARVAETTGSMPDHDSIGESRCCGSAELVRMGASYVAGHRERAYT